MAIELIEKDVAYLSDIADKEYLGRAVMVGRTEDGAKDVVAYFPTGRSGGSRARFLDKLSDGGIKTIRSTDAKPGKGNPALIYYNALTLLDNGGIVLTNGAQTDLIAETYQDLRDGTISPVELLQEAFRNPRMMDHYDAEKDQMTRIDITSFEPDKPNYTPRVSAVLGKDRAAMSLAWCNNGQVERQYFDVPLIDGTLRMLPTYTGQNVPDKEIIPHFEGSPMSMPLEVGTVQELSNLIWNSLGPKEGDVVKKHTDEGGNDFRVGVVAMFRDRATGTLDYCVINKNKPMRESE
jgi:IMP cyclohydrolase